MWGWADTSALQMDIRRYQTTDHHEVIKLHYGALEALQTDANPGPGPWDDDLQQIEDVYLVPRGEFLVGFEDGQLVAMGALRPIDETRGEIKRMRVDPKHWRRGFGQAILTALEGHARMLGYGILHLDTTIYQQAAMSLYEKNGYDQVGRGRIREFDVILYEKHLEA